MFIYEFQVQMKCGACPAAVSKALSSRQGINKYFVNMEMQRVYVETILPAEEIVDTIEKETGNETTHINTIRVQYNSRE